MAIGVDLSKRKPRRTKGTPSYAIRNRVALAVVGLGALCGVAWHFLPVSNKFQTALTSVMTYEPEGEIERKEMIAEWLAVNRTPQKLRRLQAEEASPALPYK